MRLLKQLYEISSPSEKEKQMRKFLKNYCTELGAIVSTDKTGNLYVTKGLSESYPCIVAHMDEVCPTRTKGYRVIEQNDRIFAIDFDTMKFAGIGGDDKNGIWVALKCLEKYDILKCTFFVGEEIGCVGSSNCDLTFFSDCRFVLQCDRRGANDLITSISLTELCSDEFLAATNYEKFGYKQNDGMLTDILTLKESKVNLSCLNISCGYYRPHSEEEFTVISELKNCLAFVQNIVENCTEVYPHEDIYSGYYGRKGGWRYYDDWYCYNGTEKGDKETDDEMEQYYLEYESMEADVQESLSEDYTINELPDLVNELSAIYPSLSYEDIQECVNHYYDIAE